LHSGRARQQIFSVTMATISKALGVSIEDLIK